jgi:hypothetical protein
MLEERKYITKLSTMRERKKIKCHRKRKREKPPFEAISAEELAMRRALRRVSDLERWTRDSSVILGRNDMSRKTKVGQFWSKKKKKKKQRK